MSWVLTLASLYFFPYLISLFWVKHYYTSDQQIINYELINNYFKLPRLPFNRLLPVLIYPKKIYTVKNEQIMSIKLASWEKKKYWKCVSCEQIQFTLLQLCLRSLQSARLLFTVQFPNHMSFTAPAEIETVSEFFALFFFFLTEEHPACWYMPTWVVNEFCRGFCCCLTPVLTLLQ